MLKINNLMKLRKNIWPDLDFNSLKKDKDFKEDATREEVISPLLKYLGFFINLLKLKIKSQLKQNLPMVDQQKLHIYV